jgi:predicted nucleotide-binding protein
MNDHTPSDADKDKNAKNEQPVSDETPLDDFKICLQPKNKNTVFLVCHPDNPQQRAVKEFLQSLNISCIVTIQKEHPLKPIGQVYHENQDIFFAIVLLNADLFSYEREHGNPNTAVMVSRQKIVFELGYWTACLGRDKVVALYYDQKRFRCPTEICDAMYIPMDKKGAWKAELKAKLKNTELNLND